MNFPVELPPKFSKKAEDLKIFPFHIDEQFVRGSGAGGQKVNKTSSTVLLKHMPSGIEVRCQKHREQSRNRISAYKLLINKIEELRLGRESEKSKKIFKLIKQKKRRSKKAKEKMLVAKKHRAAIKENRGNLV